MPTTMLVTMIVAFALSISVAVAIGIASIIGAWQANLSLLAVVKEMFSAINKFPLAAIPFFILAGNLMESGGISTRLVDFAKSIVGGVQGGLRRHLRADLHDLRRGVRVERRHHLRDRRHPDPGADQARLSHATTLPRCRRPRRSSASIIPPSIPMILYGVSAEVSIGELFIAGFGPGLLIGGALMLFVILYARWKGYGKSDREGQLPFLVATRRAAFALLMPVIMLGGIYGGVFTPTEASVAAVFYALIVGRARLSRDAGSAICRQCCARA